MHARGAHFVLHNGGSPGSADYKRAYESGWQQPQNAPTPEKAITHIRAGGFIGLMPMSIGLVCIDVDHGDMAAVEAVKKTVNLDPIVIHPSSSAGHYHLWYKGNAKVGSPTWELPEGKGEIRGSSGSAILWDAESLWTAYKDKFDTAQTVAISPLTKRRSTDRKRTKRGANAVRSAPEGERNNTLYQEALSAAEKGKLDIDEFRDAAIEAGLAPDEVEATISSVLQEMDTRLTNDRAADLEEALDRMGYDLRYNVRNLSREMRRKEYDTPDTTTWYSTHGMERIAFEDHEAKFKVKNHQVAPDGWFTVDDLLDGAIIEEIAETFKTRKGRRLNFRSNWSPLLNAIMSPRRTDEVEAWLTALPAWDGQKRVEGLFPQALSIEDTQMTREVAKRMMIGAVARTVIPGCVHDWLPVIIGEQGCGKSSFVKGLVPQEYLHRWFVDDVDLSEGRQKTIEGIGSAVVVEFGELAGFAVRNIESLKTFIGRQREQVRLSYRRNSESIPRRWIGIGTANNAGNGVLPFDASGSRRFVSLATPLQNGQSQGVRDWLEDNRTQLWAEAVHLFQQDTNDRAHNLDTSIAAAQKVANDRQFKRNEVAQDAAEWLTERYVGSTEGFSMAFLMADYKFVDDERAALKETNAMMQWASALYYLGWSKKPVGGRSRWFPPDADMRHEDSVEDAVHTINDAPADDLSRVDADQLRELVRKVAEIELAQEHIPLEGQATLQDFIATNRALHKASEENGLTPPMQAVIELFSEHCHYCQQPDSIANMTETESGKWECKDEKTCFQGRRLLKRMRKELSHEAYPQLRKDG